MKYPVLLSVCCHDDTLGLAIQCGIIKNSCESIVIFPDLLFFILKEYLCIEITLNFAAKPFLPFVIVMCIIRPIHIANDRKETCLQVPHPVCCCENFTFDCYRKVAGMTRVSTNCFQDFVSFCFTKSSFF